MASGAPGLFVVIGLPGAGKTRHATALAADHDALRLTSDEWMAELELDLWDEETRTRTELLQWAVAGDVLVGGGTVVIDWGTWARTERDALLGGARLFEARAELHHVHAPLPVLHRRVTERGREGPPITLADLERWSRAFEVPDHDEVARWDSFVLVDTHDD